MYRRRFAITRLGYWIVNVLLEFPGLLLNSVAAASYLDIDTESFHTEDVEALFADARYTGAFSELKPYWWTSRLDDILAGCMSDDDAMMISGRDLVTRNNVSVGPSRCLREHDGAGYYCIVNQKPVCEEHSEIPSGWLPAGADRCRIELDTYDDLRAWIEI